MIQSENINIKQNMDQQQQNAMANQLANPEADRQNQLSQRQSMIESNTSINKETQNSRMSIA